MPSGLVLLTDGHLEAWDLRFGVVFLPFEQRSLQAFTQCFVGAYARTQ